jgi:hypothetical protein
MKNILLIFAVTTIVAITAYAQSQPKLPMSDEFVKAVMTAVNSIPLGSGGNPLAKDHADQAILNVLTLSDLESDEAIRQMEKNIYLELLSFQISYSSSSAPDKQRACYEAIKTQIRQRSVQAPEVCK